MHAMEEARKSIKAIIFDWAGVFCSPGEPFAHSVFRTTGHTLEELEQAVRDDYMKFYRGGINAAEFWKTVIERLKLKNVDIESLDRAYRDSYSLYPDMLEVAGALRPHYKTALLSNLTGSMMEEILTSHNVGEYFDYVLFSNEIGHMKPEPEAFAVALQKLGTPASETLFVDDTKGNIVAAQALGFQTLHFISPEESVPGLVSWTRTRTNNGTFK